MATTRKKQVAPLVARKNNTAPQRTRRTPGRGNAGATGREDKNLAPSQWGRRVARLVGEKFGVSMSENFSKNEGVYRNKDIAIKCAKSPMPPVSVLVDMLDRIDQLWAVYLMPDGGGEVWAVDVARVREQGYFTRGLNTQKRVEIYLRKIVQIGSHVGSLTVAEVDSCRIP